MAEVSIARLRAQLEAKYKESAELFPQVGVVSKIPVIRTSSAIVNAVTGAGGFPRGRLTEVVGDYSSGKTTVALETIALLQKEDKNAVVLYLDFEHALDLAYARKLGVDLNSDRFVFAQPESFEQGDVIIDEFVSNDMVDMVVIDSAAAMTPQAELEGDVDSAQRIGAQAALMARMLTRLTKKINKGRRPALILLNQTRANIAINDPRAARQATDKPAGGSAIKFYASLRLKLEILVGEGDSNRNTKSATDQVYTQNRVRVVAFKNKVGPPWARGTFVIEYGRGIDNVASVAELAEQKLGVMSGAGFINYKGDSTETSVSGRLGRDGFVEAVRANPKLLAELEKKVISAIIAEQAETLGLKNIVQGGEAKDVGNDVVLSAAPPVKGGMDIKDIK